MGIEPTRAAVQELENKRFGAMANPKCDGRVNFRGMWGYVGIQRWAKSRARAYQSEVSERLNTRHWQCRNAYRKAAIRVLR
jgi:hypothetical protein